MHHYLVNIKVESSYCIFYLIHVKDVFGNVQQFLIGTKEKFKISLKVIKNTSLHQTSSTAYALLDD